MTGEQSERRVLVQGLAAMAITLCEMGEPEDLFRSHMLGLLQQHRVTDINVVTEAAEAIRRFPQPLMESAEETESSRPVREMLGVTSAHEQLEAQLRAREWLLRMAGQLKVEP